MLMIGMIWIQTLCAHTLWHSVFVFFFFFFYVYYHHDPQQIPLRVSGRNRGRPAQVCLYAASGQDQGGTFGAETVFGKSPTRCRTVVQLGCHCHRMDAGCRRPSGRSACLCGSGHVGDDAFLLAACDRMGDQVSLRTTLSTAYGILIERRQQHPPFIVDILSLTLRLQKLLFDSPFYTFVFPSTALMPMEYCCPLMDTADIVEDAEFVATYREFLHDRTGVDLIIET